MNTKTKSILSFGLIYGLILIALALIPYVFNLPQSKIFGYINIAVVVASLFIIQRLYKKQVYNNRIKYGQLLGGSVLIVLVAVALTTAYTYTFYTLIAPEQIDELKNLAYMELMERGISDSYLDMQISIMDKYFTAKSLTYFYFLL